MKKYTIEDFALGKCTLYNDSTKEDLIKVLECANVNLYFIKERDYNSLFFKVITPHGNCYANDDYHYSYPPLQGVSQFIKEINKIPNCGDTILVSNDGHNWVERIFINIIYNSTNGIICVKEVDEEMFYVGKCFDIETWKYYKLLPTHNGCVEISIDEIRKRFKISPDNKLSIIDNN